MPWYEVSSVSGGTSSINKYINAGLSSTPFIYNNVKYDFETIPSNYENGFYTQSSTSSGYCDGVVLYLGTNSNYTKVTFYKPYSYPQFTVYAPCGVYYSKQDAKISGFSKLKDKTINGKYKLKSTTRPAYGGLGYGCVIPIKFNLNGTDYNYLYCSPLSNYSVSNVKYSSNVLYIGGFNNLPIFNGNNFTNPSDLNSYSTKSGQNIIINFGKNNQTVPSSFYSWFIDNFERVYENTYTIKSTTGETLTTLTEAPPMISATLSPVGNAKYLTLKGENNTNYTMEWTSETPQGKIFAGLATSKGGSIVIPVGETSTINLTDSTDLYEVWQTYRPPTTTFDINLYKNSAEPNKVDKTAELSTVGTISGVLRQECSLIDPEIIIQYDKPPDFNYCYIANFGRYYYVENIVSMRQNLWRIRLRCDVLMTYKTQILNLNARIARQQYTYSYRQIDSEIPFTNDPEITVQDIPNNLNLGKPNYENILLTVVDGST